jgi:hypothetical protein
MKVKKDFLKALEVSEYQHTTGQRDNKRNVEKINEQIYHWYNICFVDCFVG